MPRNLKVRQVIVRLRQLGCRPVRSKGSHQTWKAPNGACCPIKINHLGADMSPRVLSCVRQWLRDAGLDLDGGTGTLRS